MSNETKGEEWRFTSRPRWRENRGALAWVASQFEIQAKKEKSRERWQTICPDGQGIGTATAEVRAERDGSADGRVYHIGFTATDSVGGTCTGTVTVCVPLDPSQPRCGDEGPKYDSTKCP